MLSALRRHLTVKRLRWLAGVGGIGLAAVGLAYWLSHDRAPSIRVRWRDDLPIERQAELEEKYLLSNGREPKAEAPRSIAYDLVDTSWLNIRALVNDPAVADTNDVDREGYRVQPGTSLGERWTWLAYRIPGLHDPRAVWLLVIVLLAMALTGFLGLAAVRDRAQATVDGRREHSAGTGDLFDKVFSSPSPIRTDDVPGHSAMRVVAAGLIVAALGVPVLQTWEALFLAAALLMALFGRSKRGWWRSATAAAVVIGVIALKAALPRADLAEAHNAFTVMNGGEPLERGLPPEVFRSWKAQFDAVYPASADPPRPYTWRAHDAFPESLYTESSDAIWRKPKYTRQVDTIDFRTLGEFRGGFANELRNNKFQYNFWRGEIARESMPFYVMYELTPRSVGSELTWRGQLFWERSNGTFDEIVHSQVGTRLIGPDDAGKRVYKVFFPVRDEPFDFEMRPSRKLWMAALAETILTVIAAMTVLALTVRPRWGAYLRALALFLAGYLVMTSFHDAGGTRYLAGSLYVPHAGGDDGLAHDGWGRLMAMQAGQGALGEALKGGEAVYWFTPGARYVRMVEKLVFGDTNHLFALLIACVPIAVFYLVRRLAGCRPAWIVTAIFCLMPVGNLSFLQYVRNAGIGYGEAIGGGLFLAGLALVLGSQPAWNGSAQRHPAAATIGGAALAASMFVRPNFALAVVWVGAVYTWASLRRRDFTSVIALGLGLGLALWMPLHNWVYGGEFYLISKAGATISVPISFSDYGAALRDGLRGDFQTSAMTVVFGQLNGWLANPGAIELYRDSLAPWTTPAHAIRLFALIVTCWVALRWVATGFSKSTNFAVVAVAAILAEVPMLFVHTTFDRYAMLGWDLSLIVLAVWVARQYRAWSSRRADAFVGAAVAS